MKPVVMATAILLALLILSVTPFSADPASVSGQTSPFYWESVDVRIELQPNGDLLVSETQKYVFTEQHTTERFRWIPLDRVDAITDVQVSENGLLLGARTGTEGDRFWIRWNHPLNAPESRTFLIEYRVKGGLHIEEGGDRIFWKALFKDRSGPINDGQVTVHLPAMLGGQVTGFQSFGSSATAQQIDDRTIVFTSQGPLPPGDELEVEVTFPHGALAVPVPQWQQGGINLFPWAVGFTLPMLLGAWLARAVWARIKGWRISYPSAQEVVSEPPGDLSAGAVSLLESRTVGAGAVLSTVVEMCQRGVLTMEGHEKGAFLWKSKEFSLSRGGPPERPWEQLIYEQVGSRTLLSNRCLDRYRDEIGALLGQFLAERGLFEENPVSAYRAASGNRWRLTVWGLLGSTLLGLGAGLWLALLGPIPGILGGGALFVAGAALLFRHIPYIGKIRPTEAGWNQILRWRSYKDYLKAFRDFRPNPDGSSGADSETATDQFDAALPYAIALGVAGAWISAAASAHIPAPLWFHYIGAAGATGDSQSLHEMKAAFQGFLGATQTAFGYAPSGSGFAGGAGGAGGGGGGGGGGG